MSTQSSAEENSEEISKGKDFLDESFTELQEKFQIKFLGRHLRRNLTRKSWKNRGVPPHRNPSGISQEVFLEFLNLRIPPRILSEIPSEDPS